MPYACLYTCPTTCCTHVQPHLQTHVQTHVDTHVFTHVCCRDAAARFGKMANAMQCSALFVTVAAGLLRCGGLLRLIGSGEDLLDRLERSRDFFVVLLLLHSLPPHSAMYGLGLEIAGSRGLLEGCGLGLGV